MIKGGANCMAKKNGNSFLSKLPGQILYIGKEVTKDYFNDYTENVTSLINDAKEVGNSISEGKTKVVDIVADIKQNGAKKAMDWFMQRTDESDEYGLMGNNDSDFDAGFQVGPPEEDEGDAPKTRILDEDSMKDIARGQVNAMYQIGAKQAEASIINAAEIVSHIDGRASEIVTSLNNMNKSIIGIGEKLDALGQLLQTQSQIQEEQAKMQNESMMDANGRVSLGSWFKAMSANLKDATVGNTYVQLLASMKDQLTPAGLISFLLADTKDKKLGKLGGLAGSGIDKLTSLFGKETNFKDKMKDASLNQVGGAFNNMIGSKVSDTLLGTNKKLDEVLQKIPMFGDMISEAINKGMKERLPTIGEYQSEVKNAYNREKAEFDGITRQSIVEIIPGYLKIMAQSMTGKRWDHEKGFIAETNGEKRKLDTADISMYEQDLMYSAGGSKERRARLTSQISDHVFTFHDKQGNVTNKRKVNQQEQNSVADLFAKNERQLFKFFNLAIQQQFYGKRREALTKDAIKNNIDWDLIIRCMCYDGILGNGGNNVCSKRYTNTVEINGHTLHMTEDTVRMWVNAQRYALENPGADGTNMFTGENERLESFIGQISQLLTRAANAEIEYVSTQAAMGHKAENYTPEALALRFEHDSELANKQTKLAEQEQAEIDRIKKSEAYKKAVEKDQEKNKAIIGNANKIEEGAAYLQEALEDFKHTNDDYKKLAQKIQDMTNKGFVREDIDATNLRSAVDLKNPIISKTETVGIGDKFQDNLFDSLGKILKAIQGISSSKSQSGNESTNIPIPHNPQPSTTGAGDVPPWVYKNIYGGAGDDKDKQELSDTDREDARSANDILVSEAQDGELGGQEVAFVRRLTANMKNREMANRINQRATLWATTLKQSSLGKAVSNGLEKTQGKTGIGGFVAKAFAVVSSVGKMIIGKIGGFLGKHLIKPLMSLAMKGFKSGWRDIKKGFATIFNKPYDEKAAHSEEMAEATKQTSLLESLLNSLKGHWDEEKREKMKKEGKLPSEGGGEEEPKKQGFFGRVKQKASDAKQFVSDKAGKVAKGASTLKEATSNTFKDLKDAWQNRGSAFDGGADRGQTASDKDGPRPTLGSLAKEGMGKVGSGLGKTVGKIGKTLGNFAKGSLSIMKGIGKIILTAVASLSAVKILMDTIQKTLTKSLKPLNKGLKTLISHLKPLIAKMGKVVSAIAGSLTGIIAQLSPFIDKVVEFTSDVLSALLPVIDPVLGTLTIIAGAIEPILDLIQPTLPKIAGAVTIAVGVLQSMYATIEGIGGALIKGIGWIVKKFNGNDSIEKTGDELLNKSVEGLTQANDTMSDGWNMMTGKKEVAKETTKSDTSATSTSVQITPPVPSTGGAVDAISGSGDEDDVSDGSTLTQQLAPYLTALANEVHGIRGVHEEYIKPSVEAQTVYEDSMLKMQDDYIKREQMMSSKVLIPMYSKIKNDVVPGLESIEALQKVQIGNDAAYYGQALGAAGLQLVAAGQQAAGAALFQTSIGLSAAGMVYQSEGATAKANATSYLLTGKPFYMSSLYNEPGSEDTTETTETSSAEIVNEDETKPTETTETTTGGKATIEVPEVSNTRRIREYLATEGSGDSQGSYGSYLNMSKRGCGPVALADAANRRGGSVNAGALAGSMASAGNYSSSRGTSVGGFLSTAASMGMGYTPGGVTSQSLGRATPNNPITLVGSGAGFGTRSGNTHYINVVGTDRAGGAYVSNPLSGRVERRSANELAASSVLGLYGSGDIGSIPSGLYGLYAGDGYDIYGNDITKFGGDTNHYSPGGWDYFEKLGEKIYDWKESNDQYDQLTKSTWSKNNAVNWYEKEASSAQQGWIKTMYANENPHSIGFASSIDKCQTWLVNKLNSLAQSNSSLGWINRKTSSFNSLLSAAAINSGKKNNNSSSSSTQTSSSIQTSSTPTKKNLNLNRDKTTLASNTITKAEAAKWYSNICSANTSFKNGLEAAYRKYNKSLSAVQKTGDNAYSPDLWWYRDACILFDSFYQTFANGSGTNVPTFAKWYNSLSEKVSGGGAAVGAILSTPKGKQWMKVAEALMSGNDPLLQDVATEAASNESENYDMSSSAVSAGTTAAAQSISVSAPPGGRTGYISTEQKYAHDSTAGSEVPQVEGDSFAERMKSAMAGLKGIFGKILGLFSTDSETEVEDAVTEDKNKKMERVIREAIGNEEYEEYMNQAFDLYKKEHPKYDTETEDKYNARITNAWANEDTRRKYFLAVTKNNANVMNAMKSNNLFDASEGSMSTMYGEYDASTGEWSGGLLNAALGGGSGSTIVETAYNDPYAGKFVSDGGAIMYTDSYQPTIFDTNITDDAGMSQSQSPVHEFFLKTSGITDESAYSFSKNGNWFTKRNKPDTVGIGSEGEEHKGIDIMDYPKSEMEAGNAKLLAITSGTVTDVRFANEGNVNSPYNQTDDGGWGNSVQFKDAGGIFHRYAHMRDKPTVNIGDTITGGQLLGVIGDTGHSDGEHVHYQLQSGDGSEENNTYINPLTYFKYHQPAASQGAVQGEIPFEGILGDHNAWDAWEKKYHDEWPGFIQKGATAGMTPAEIATIGAMGIWEDNARKFFGDKSLTATTHDNSGQRAEGIMNWVEKGVAGNTLEDQLKYVKDRYFRMQPMPGHESSGTYRKTIDEKGGEAIFKQTTGRSEGFHLNVGDRYADMLNTDLIEGATYYNQGDLQPSKVYTTTGLAENVGTAVGMYNWMLRNGYAVAPSSYQTNTANNAAQNAVDPSQIGTGQGGPDAYSTYSDQNTNMGIIWNYLRNNLGYSEEASAGVMGNLSAESGYFPMAVYIQGGADHSYPDDFNKKLVSEVDSGKKWTLGKNDPYGIAQWLDGRRGKLLDKAFSENKSIADLPMQLEFIRGELESSEKKTHEQMKSIGSVDSAADYWRLHFERCGEQAAEKRRTRAQEAYNKFKGTNGGAVNVNGGQFGSAAVATRPEDTLWINTLHRAIKATDDAGLHGYVYGGNTTVELDGKTIHGRPDCTGLIQWPLSYLGYDLDNVQSDALVEASSSNKNPIKKDGENSPNFEALKWGSEVNADTVVPGDIVVRNGHGEIAYGKVGDSFKVWNYGSDDSIVATQKVASQVLSGTSLSDAASNLPGAEHNGSSGAYAYAIRPTGELSVGVNGASASGVATGGMVNGYWVGKFPTAVNWAAKTYGYGGAARNSGQGKGFSSYAFGSIGGISNFVDVNDLMALQGANAGTTATGGGNLAVGQFVDALTKTQIAADEQGLHSYSNSEKSIELEGRTLTGRPDCSGMVMYAADYLGYDNGNIQSTTLVNASKKTKHPIKKNGEESEDWTVYKWQDEIKGEDLQMGDIVARDINTNPFGWTGYGHVEVVGGVKDGHIWGWNYGGDDAIIATQKAAHDIANGKEPLQALMDNNNGSTNIFDGSEGINQSNLYNIIIRPTQSLTATNAFATNGIGNATGTFTDSSLAKPMFMTPLDKDENGNPTEDIFYGERGRPITKMTWHTWADDGELEDCVGWWKSGQGKQTDGQKKEEAAGGKHKTGVSANYIIDTAGNIGQPAHESIATHTTSNEDNDRSAITVEIANSKGASGPSWPITDASLNAAKKLTVDVAKRNNIKSFNYTAKKDGYNGDGKDGTWTYHRMFSLNGKSCPGDYIVNKTDSILADINKQISGSGDEIPIPPIDQSKIMTTMQPSILSDYVEDTSQIPPANKTNIIVAKSSQKEIEMMERMMNHTYNVRAEQVEILLQTIIDKMDHFTNNKSTSTQTPSQPQNQFPNNNIPKQIQQLARG